MTTSEFIDIIETINRILAALFFVCCAYRILYLAVPFFRRIRHRRPTTLHKFAVLISARNEENVIPHLLDSIRAQNYPAELIRIFVVADNCTDGTARVSREHGATVYERFNPNLVGKGYALNWLLENIRRDFGWESFDGYFVFDADNLLSPDYISEMNKTFSDGYKVITSYRNSKNYGDNWISSGYSLWFLHEAKYLNYSRMALGTSCAVSGTGFMFSNEVLKKADGWNFFLLTEDIEFTAWNVVGEETIGYCHSAMFYDEQPTRFDQSWRQRLRWAKGYLQVFRNYGAKLFLGFIRGKGFACYDIAMSILPAIVITITGLILDAAASVITVAAGGNALPIVLAAAKSILGSYIFLFFIGLLPLITEWKNIRASVPKKLLSLVTFPLFMMTYVPISLAAVFAHVEWKPIEHKAAIRFSDLK